MVASVHRVGSGCRRRHRGGQVGGETPLRPCPSQPSPFLASSPFRPESFRLLSSACLSHLSAAVKKARLEVLSPGILGALNVEMARVCGQSCLGLQIN